MISQDYHDQTILITGAASGIGYAQMQTYLAAGARVLAVDQQMITVQHPRLTNFQLNLTDEQAVSDWLLTLPPVDIFLSTAGVLDNFTPATQTDLQTIKRVMAVNATAPIQITLHLLPQMIKRQSGMMIFMTSIAGQIAGGGGAAYTMSKHALVGWMKQLALDYAADGIRVNAIAPGAIDTPMNAADFAGDGAIARSVAAQTPVRRWAQAQEVADLTLYLTSPQASYMQGQVVTLDGGWTIK